MKPILFNTEMVQAILDGRKTVTRRVIKRKYSNTHLEVFTNKYGTRLIELQNEVEEETFGKNQDGGNWHKLLGMVETEYEHKPYKKGDILWIRETWHTYTKRVGNGENCKLKEFYGYKASVKNSEDSEEKWKPSIHMPKDAARIFLKVTNVRIERLQTMSKEDCLKEGISLSEAQKYEDILPKEIKNTTSIHHLVFRYLWDSTVKDGADMYCSNPWVWVIEFERCERPMEKNNQQKVFTNK